MHSETEKALMLLCPQRGRGFGAQVVHVVLQTRLIETRSTSEVVDPALLSPPSQGQVYESPPHS